MKITRLLTLSVLAAAFLLSACSKNNNPSPESVEESYEQGPFTAKVDNQAFAKTEVALTKATFISSTKMLQIIGQPKDQKETIILTLMPFGGKVSVATDWKPGEYDFDPIHVTRLEYLASAEYNKWNGNGYDQWFTKWDYVKTGKITIESNTGTRIKGTFSFDAVRKNTDGTYNTSSIKTITAGKFDLEIK